VPQRPALAKGHSRRAGAAAPSRSAGSAVVR